jgi:hypothetical protein
MGENTCQQADSRLRRRKEDLNTLRCLLGLGLTDLSTNITELGENLPTATKLMGGYRKEMKEENKTPCPLPHKTKEEEGGGKKSGQRPLLKRNHTDFRLRRTDQSRDHALVIIGESLTARPLGFLNISVINGTKVPIS